MKTFSTRWRAFDTLQEPDRSGVVKASFAAELRDAEVETPNADRLPRVASHDMHRHSGPSDIVSMPDYDHISSATDGSMVDLSWDLPGYSGCLWLIAYAFHGSPDLKIHGACLVGRVLE